jgi:hypothetical protein
MRQTILQTMISTLEPLDFALAFWQGGSAAHGYTDEWSDIDVHVVVEDMRVEETFEIIETALRSIADICWKCRLPEPTWHGHSQCFYQLEGISPFLAIDFVVMKLSNSNRYLEVERHGNAVIAFDKANLLTVPTLDRTAHFSKMAERLTWLKKSFEFQQIIVKKEINRGLLVEAISGYHAWTMRPLVELLGMVYRPYRYDFMTKYFSRDFPPEIVARVEPLYCIKSLADLSDKQLLAEALFYEILPQAEAMIQQVI